MRRIARRGIRAGQEDDFGLTIASFTVIWSVDGHGRGDSESILRHISEYRKAGCEHLNVRLTVGRASRMRGNHAVEVYRTHRPGGENHPFVKYAATVAHQNGTPYVLSESFALYGNGLTIEQMKWVVDFQYVRGVNLLVMGCYPLSTRDHMMPGLRPHFGPVNPLWDHMREFHRYVARLGYALACGSPMVETALYYPARDMWARGVRDETIEGYEALAEALLERQCDFDLIDDDLLSDRDTGMEEGSCKVGPMHYRRIIIGPCRWMRPEALVRLSEYVLSGGKLLCMDGLPEADGAGGLGSRLGEEVRRVKVAPLNDLLKGVPPLVELSPPSTGIRAAGRRLPEGGLYFLFNEGDTPYEGLARFKEPFPPKELDPCRGEAWASEDVSRDGGGVVVPLDLQHGESRLLLFDSSGGRRPTRWEPVPGAKITLAKGWRARPIRQFHVGPHDYEARELPDEAWEPRTKRRWTCSEIPRMDGASSVATTTSSITKWSTSSLKTGPRHPIL